MNIQTKLVAQYLARPDADAAFRAVLVKFLDAYAHMESVVGADLDNPAHRAAIEAQERLRAKLKRYPTTDAGALVAKIEALVWPLGYAANSTIADVEMSELMEILRRDGRASARCARGCNVGGLGLINSQYGK